jgi:hypothetical protein
MRKAGVVAHPVEQRDENPFVGGFDPCPYKSPGSLPGLLQFYSFSCLSSFALPAPAGNRPFFGKGTGKNA